MTDEIVNVRAPRAGEWIEVHPDPKMRLDAVIVRDDDGEIYMVAEHMVEHMQKLPEAAKRLESVIIFTARNMEGETFLWPVRRPVSRDHLAWRAMGVWTESETDGEVLGMTKH